MVPKWPVQSFTGRTPPRIRWEEGSQLLGARTMTCKYQPTEYLKRGRNIRLPSTDKGNSFKLILFTFPIPEGRREEMVNPIIVIFYHGLFRQSFGALNCFKAEFQGLPRGKANHSACLGVSMWDTRRSEYSMIKVLQRRPTPHLGICATVVLAEHSETRSSIFHSLLEGSREIKDLSSIQLFRLLLALRA